MFRFAQFSPKRLKSECSITQQNFVQFVKPNLPFSDVDSMSLLLSVLKCKSIFDRLEADELRKARTRSNPFETIRSVIFLNRAAMKMANMDAVFDFMFTNPSKTIMLFQGSIINLFDWC